MLAYSCCYRPCPGIRDCYSPVKASPKARPSVGFFPRDQRCNSTPLSSHTLLPNPNLNTKFTLSLSTTPAMADPSHGVIERDPVKVFDPALRYLRAVDQKKNSQNLAKVFASALRYFQPSLKRSKDAASSSSDSLLRYET